MRCLILLNGMENKGMRGEEREFYRELAEKSDIIICADGGLNAADELGIEPDIVIGDMDSVRKELLQKMDERRIIRYPKEKDLTDGRLALNYAVEIGCDEITLTCALSDRMDHSLANIQMLSSVPEGIGAMIAGPDLEVFVMKGSSRMVIKGKKGDRVSLIPLSELVEGIDLKGLKYGLKNGRFTIEGMNGISNEMAEEEAEVRIKKGILAVFHYG